MPAGDLLGEIAAESVRAAKPSYPDGYQPGLELRGDHGTITGESANAEPDWRALLAYWNLDPDAYEVVGDVNVRTWDAAVGNGEVRRFWYHKANIRRRRAGAADLPDLLAIVGKRRAANPAPVSEPGAYALCLNDLQLGKKGTAATVDRVIAGIDASVARIRELRRGGRSIESIWLMGLGDLVEATSGHYPMQQHEVELDGRDQAKLARRLILRAIDAHRGLAPRIVVPCVAGNHGEKRTDGKATTTFADNIDVEVFETVAEACATNPAAYGHVRFLIPGGDLSLTVQPVEGGPIIALAHGHQARRGSSPQLKLKDWWSGQAYGGRPAGDASILLVGHYHQFLVHADGPRTLMIAPTVDSGSQWYAETAGVESVPGMLSFVVTPTGWDDLRLL